MIWISLFHNQLLFFKYFSLLIWHGNGSVINIHRWISVFRREKKFVNILNGLQVTTIFVIQENSGVFIETPCSFKMASKGTEIAAVDSPTSCVKVSFTIRKWLYLSPWAKILKTRGTLFSQILKVEENKVPLFFQFWLWGWDTAIFSFFVDHINKGPSKS